MQVVVYRLVTYLCYSICTYTYTSLNIILCFFKSMLVLQSYDLHIPPSFIFLMLGGISILTTLPPFKQQANEKQQTFHALKVLLFFQPASTRKQHYSANLYNDVYVTVGSKDHNSKVELTSTSLAFKVFGFTKLGFSISITPCVPFFFCTHYIVTRQQISY